MSAVAVGQPAATAEAVYRGSGSGGKGLEPDGARVVWVGAALERSGREPERRDSAKITAAHGSGW